MQYCESQLEEKAKLVILYVSRYGSSAIANGRFPPVLAVHGLS